MDLFEKAKIWRGIGKIVDSKIGSSISEAVAQPMNWISSKAVSTNNADIPWTPFSKPLAESRLAIVSTAGFYLEGDEPFDVDSTQGDASFRTIPSNFSRDKLKIAHTHYSHSRVDQDLNVLFPIDRLLELVEADVIGSLSDNFFSFGFGGILTQEFIGQPDGSAHQLARALKADDLDYVLMVPA